MRFNILWTYPKKWELKLGSLKRPRVVKEYSNMLKFMLFHVAPYHKDQSFVLAHPAPLHASYPPPMRSFSTFHILFVVASRVFAVES